MKFESYDHASKKNKWKIVRRDNLSDVPGDIISCNTETGDAYLLVDGQTVTFGSYPDGIILVRRSAV